MAIDAHSVRLEQRCGFRESGFGPDGALSGFGWSSVFATSLGMQYKMWESVYFIPMRLFLQPEPHP